MNETTARPPQLTESTDRIEKQTVYNVPRSRLWRAIADVKQFNQWFGAEFTTPFAPGAVVTGKLTVRGYEHLDLTVWIEKVEPERVFSFRWHPFAIEAGVDYSKEPTTLVTLTIDEVEGGTRLTVVESGFDAIPESRRARAFKANGNGWASQLENVRKYLARTGHAGSGAAS